MNKRNLQQNRSNMRKPILAACVLVPLMALVVSGLPGSSNAETESLTGSWSGGGWVAFASGAKERARCQARYSRASGNSYTLTASCATSSAKASQTATVSRVSDNRYHGSFHNTEYNVSGSISVVVHGKSQSVNLAGDGASASLQLSRR